MNQIIINADLGKHTINRHIFGHFAEHLGRCIYGGVWVGEDSPIPNTRGMRNDIIQTLRAINIPNLRWPGGCFADEYHWMDGIGPKEQRPYMVNTHWGGVTENNQFGTHEFMDLCELLDCEPYICGNVGSGTVQEMQQWVEYITFDGQSPMADLRRQNGQEQPWRIKYWGVGNENWGCGGSMTAEYYAGEYCRYQTYVRNFNGNQIYKIACGPRNNDYHWTEVLMRETLSRHGRPLLNGLSMHYYTVGHPHDKTLSATKFEEDEWFVILRDAFQMDEYVSGHSAVMDRYDPEKKVGMIVDEWGTWYAVEAGTNPRFLYQQNSLRDALVAAIHLDIFCRHCDRVHMANIAQTINVLQALVLTEQGSERMVLTPTYHVFEMYKAHQDAILLPLDLQCVNYAFGDDVIPAVSATASRNRAGQIHVTLSNLTPGQDFDLNCTLRGVAATEVMGRILTAKQINAVNTFDEPNRVSPTTFSEAKLDSGDKLYIKLPAKSVVVLTIS